MSKRFEQIGRISAAVSALPESHLGIALDAMNKIADPAWKARLTKVFREGPNPTEAIDRFLEPLGKVVIDIDQEITREQINVFLKEREGLYIEETFERLFGDAIECELPTQIELSKFCLKKKVLNLELSSSHIFGAYEFRAMLVSQLERQWGGAEGILRTDGLDDIFYVKADDGGLFVVSVQYTHREWCVHVWNFADPRWPRIGLSVYYRN